MKIKWGALVVDGRNKIGGQVASKNRAGAYMRNKVTPVNPQTSFQTTVRNRLTSFSQSWRDLTAAQILAWNAAVENFKRTDIFGDLKTPTGLNLYNRLNLNLAAANAPSISDPPSPSTTTALTSLSFVPDQTAGTMLVAFAPTPIPAGHRMVISATAPYSPGITFVKNRFRQVTVFNAGVATGADLYSFYIAKFGAPAVGEKISIEAKLTDTNTGLTSLALRADATVV